MDMKTYLAESERTVSPVFDTSVVNAYDLAGVLEVIARTVEPLDQIKKTIYYRRELDDNAFEAVCRQEGYYQHIYTAEYDGLDPLILHALLGIITEAGEMAEALVAGLNSGKFDTTNLKEEGGDQLWYLAMLFRQLGTTFEAEGERNIEKLRKRFPHKFDENFANVRNLAAEREVLGR